MQIFYCFVKHNLLEKIPQNGILNPFFDERKICNKHFFISTVNVRNPNVRFGKFGKPNKKWFGFQHFPISDVRFVLFVRFKRLDNFILKFFLNS